jgi:hypothetical protein
MQSAGGAGEINAAIKRIGRHERNVDRLLQRRNLYR